MTASEQRLALVLGAVVLLGGSFIALTKLKAWKGRVDTLAMEVETRRLEADDLLSQKDFWSQRSAWLEEKLPQHTIAGESLQKLLDRIDTLASKYEVSLPQKQPGEPVERPGLTSANVTVTAQGKMKALLQWLHELQQPDEFISIPSINFIPAEEKSEDVIATMNIQKWFRLPPP